MFVSKADLARMKEEFRKGLTTVVTKGVRKSSDGNEAPGSTDQPFSISKYLGGIVNGFGRTSQVEKAAHEAVLKSDTYTTDQSSQGGVLVPQQVYGVIAPRLAEQAIFRNIPGLRVIPMQGISTSVRRVTHGAQISWGSEAGEIQADVSMKTAADAVQLSKAVCLIRLSNELLQTPGAYADDCITEELTSALAEAETNALCEGLGGQQPTGMYYRTDINSTDLGASIDQDDCLRASLACEENGANVNAWIMNSRCKHAIRILKDAEGRFILTSTDGYGNNKGEIRTLPMLFGAGVYVTNQIASTMRPDANETFLLTGDFSQFQLFDGTIRLDISPHSRFSSDECEIRVCKRVGYALRQPKAFCRVVGINVAD